MSTSSENGRRTFIKGFAATLALRPSLGAGQISMEETLLLREPVVISRADLDRAGGSVAFDAWFYWGGRDRVVGGLLLDLDRISLSTVAKQPANPPEPTYVAYVTNCPHEACKVRLESDPEILARAAEGVKLPAASVMLCPCHFSLFDLGKDGSRFAGPAWRGLYRFVSVERGGSIIIDRVERAVVELFG